MVFDLGEHRLHAAGADVDPADPLRVGGDDLPVGGGVAGQEQQPLHRAGVTATSATQDRALPGQRPRHIKEERPVRVHKPRCGAGPNLVEQLGLGAVGMLFGQHGQRVGQLGVHAVIEHHNVVLGQRWPVQVGVVIRLPAQPQQHVNRGMVWARVPAGPAAAAQR